MRHFLTLITMLLLASSVATAAPPTAEEKAAASLKVYDQVLTLTAEQAKAVEKGLIDKYTVGKKAYALKKAGEEAEGKKMNQQAGKEFNQLMRETLTAAQWSTFQDKRDKIKAEIQKIQ